MKLAEVAEVEEEEEKKVEIRDTSDKQGADAAQNQFCHHLGNRSKRIPCRQDLWIDCRRKRRIEAREAEVFQEDEEAHPRKK